jgi:hypothetical protein
VINMFGGGCEFGKTFNRNFFVTLLSLKNYHNIIGMEY